MHRVLLPCTTCCSVSSQYWRTAIITNTRFATCTTLTLLQWQAFWHLSSFSPYLPNKRRTERVAMKHKPFIFMLMVVFMLGLWLHWSSIEKGERLAVENCGGCHDLSAEKKNKRGPYLWGIVNRRAGIAD